MTSLTERIAQTNPGKPRTAEVTVSLDADVSEQREQLEAELASAESDPRLTSDPAADVRERIAALEEQEQGALLTLRFTKLSGLEWAKLGSQNPPRRGVNLDRTVGYDVDAVAIAAAELNGVIVEDDGTETVPVVKDAVKDETGRIVEPAVNEWPGLWAALSGWDVRNVIESLFDLNVGQAAGRMARLKKASKAADA